MTDKPKRKNLSPDELLQQAKLLYPENEAFVRGETKNLYNHTEILANSYHRLGFSMSDGNLQKPHRNRFIEFMITFVLSLLVISIGTFGIFLFVVSLTIHDSVVFLCSALAIGLYGIITIGGLMGIRNLWNIATTSENKMNARIVKLVKEGRLMIGTWICTDGRYQKSFTFSYISPKSGKLRRTSWYSTRYKFMQKGDNLILLYLNDECVIVL